MIDIKTLNIPNVCFSLVENDETGKYKKQRIERGFDDSETWSLCNTIAAFIIPRLKRFIEINEEIRRDDELHDKCKVLLNAFKLIDRDEGSWDFTDVEQTIVDDGLRYFPEIFMKLCSLNI